MREYKSVVNQLRRQVIASLEAQIAREDDPISSHLAADEVTQSGARLRQLVAVLILVCKHPGKTSLELAQYGLDRYIIARRLPELERSGAVERGGFTLCSVGGRTAIKWMPSAEAVATVEDARKACRSTGERNAEG
jgi:hypothetical protein